jgi:Flp pilus assembly pilin Flp
MKNRLQRFRQEPAGSQLSEYALLLLLLALSTLALLLLGKSLHDVLVFSQTTSTLTNP